MSVSRMVSIFILSITCSCNHPDKKQDKDHPLANSTVAVDSSKKAGKVVIPIKTINYDNWKMFWTAFTMATSKKDTTIIAQLTNFPFLQNGSLTGRREFMELWISQTYEIKETDTAVLSSEVLLRLGEHERASLPKFDSVYYTNRHHKDFYFAKVNGYYRLVEIITPG